MSLFGTKWGKCHVSQVAEQRFYKGFCNWPVTVCSVTCEIIDGRLISQFTSTFISISNLNIPLLVSALNTLFTWMFRPQLGWVW